MKKEKRKRKTKCQGETEREKSKDEGRKVHKWGLSTSLSLWSLRVSPHMA